MILKRDRCDKHQRSQQDTLQMLKHAFFSSLRFEEDSASTNNHLEGLVKRGDRYLIYYGAADKSVRLAKFKLVRKRL